MRFENSPSMSIEYVPVLGIDMNTKFESSDGDGLGPVNLYVPDFIFTFTLLAIA